ncbi:MAG: hypothetical protein AAF414_03375 [Pseudomonadota bacterium]
MKVASYEELFLSRTVPLAHLIFTDIDRLSVYEVETAQAMVDALVQAEVGATIVNEPAHVLCRYGLLSALFRAGINSFRAERLDGGPIGLDYPLFLRREDEALGPETELINCDQDLTAAVSTLRAKGRPQRGRLAVEYRAQPSADGLFRKYAAFLVNGEILPQHIQSSDGWAVKRDSKTASADQAAEELNYVKENPHREVLQKAFDLANIGFGRIDYGIVDERVEVYEINTNPTFPNSDKPDLRQERRKLVRQRLVDAFIKLDQPLTDRGHVRFKLPRPRVHRLPAPRNPLARWVYFRRAIPHGRRQLGPKPARTSPTETG